MVSEYRRKRSRQQSSTIRARDSAGTQGDDMGMEDHLVEQREDSHYGLASEEKQPVQGYIAIKGTRNGLLLTMEPETPFGELLNALAERLAEAPGFFRGASLSVDTSRRSLRVSERTQLEALLAHYQMSVMPLETATVPRKHAAPAVPHPASTSPVAQATGDGMLLPAQRDPRASDDTLFLRRTVRSGQAIHHHSNIVVLGDVNPGAEIIA